MVLDQELLRKAEAAGSRVAETERQTQLARAEYHTVVRRLHLAGGSLREIAQALGLSHQRVQQIVNAGGGSWWQRIWRTRNPKRDAVCTFCERPPSEVAKLIAGPDVYICDSCVARAEVLLGGGARSSRTPPLTVATGRARARCSFCGGRNGRERPLAAGSAAAVCGECLRLCREILTDRAG